MMLLSVISVSLSLLASKLSLIMGINSGQVVMFRFLIPLIIVTPLFLMKPEFNKKLIVANILRSLWLFLAQFSLIYSMEGIPIGGAVALYYLAPVYVALVSSIKNKNIPTLVILSAFAGFLGVVFITYNGELTTTFNTYVIAGILSGVFFSMSQMWIHKLSRSQSALSSIFYTYFFALIPTFFVSKNLSMDLIASKDFLLFTILLVGIFSLISQMFRLIAYRAVSDISKLTPILYFSVFLASIYDILFFDNVINYKIVIGTILIIVSSIMARKENETN